MKARIQKQHYRARVDEQAKNPDGAKLRAHRSNITMESGSSLRLPYPDIYKYIARLLDHGADSELREIFRVVEELHLHGDAYVREAATVGSLENLQNTNVVGVDVPTRCLGYLGPESLRQRYASELKA